MPPTDDQPLRVLTKGDVEAVVDCLVDRISDRRTVEQVTAAWSGVIDRAIGRGVRRLTFAVVFAVVVFGAVKFGLIDKAITAVVPMKGN